MTMSKAFQSWVKLRSYGEGGYADIDTAPNDTAHHNGDITVRGWVTSTFKKWAEAGGVKFSSTQDVFQKQISMLRGKNEPINAVQYTLPNGITVTSESGLMTWAGKKVPALSNTERGNPTNELYLLLKKTLWDYTITKTALNNADAGIQLIFADLEYAGGACYGTVLFGIPNDNTQYGWSSGFRKFLNVKYAKNINTTYSGRNLTSEDIKQLNSIGSKIFDDYYEYAVLRFRRCNSMQTYNTYKNGWETAARTVRDTAKSVSDFSAGGLYAKTPVQKGLIAGGLIIFAILFVIYVLPKIKRMF